MLRSATVSSEFTDGRERSLIGKVELPLQKNICFDIAYPCVQVFDSVARDVQHAYTGVAHEGQVVGRVAAHVQSAQRRRNSDVRQLVVVDYQGVQTFQV